jgi:hypothetical protein
MCVLLTIADQEIKQLVHNGLIVLVTAETVNNKLAELMVDFSYQCSLVESSMHQFLAEFRMSTLKLLRFSVSLFETFL